MKTVHVLQQAPHESLGSLESHFRAAGVACRNVPLYQTPEPAWDWNQVAALVVLGGHMNVDEVAEYPFLQQEVDWIREALQRNVPVLGICLGAQLLAKSLGARVYANPVKEIGWYDIEVLAAADDPMFGGLKGPHTVFQWHGDTFDLPAGAVQLARSALCEQQAFRCGATAFGLQFHLEVTAPMVEQWLTVPGNLDELRGAPGCDAEQIRRRLPETIGRMESLGNRVLPRFVEMCRTSQK